MKSLTHEITIRITTNEPENIEDVVRMVTADMCRLYGLKYDENQDGEAKSNVVQFKLPDGRMLH